METIDSLKAEILSLRKQLKEKDKLISGLKLTIKKAEIGEPEETFQRPLKPPRRSLEVGQNILKDDEAGNNLRSQTGTIKALPRELSIFNSDDDDITQYSQDDGNLKVTENSEMRDAYNARGIYTGQVSRKHQLPHGRGRMVYHHQGRSYEGEWNTGHWHGSGVTRNALGDCYEGQFVNDLKEGEGRLEYADGRVFEGLFKQDDAIKGNEVFSNLVLLTTELATKSVLFCIFCIRHLGFFRWIKIRRRAAQWM